MRNREFTVENTSANKFIELTASIVSAYVSNNSVPSADLPALIGQVHTALSRVANHGEGSSEAPRPAISVKKSITSDYIVCLEDGKKFKSLKRHLRTQYSMTPEQYRDKWNLPADYPMVAPNYAVARSQLASKIEQETLRWIGQRIWPGADIFNSAENANDQPPTTNNAFDGTFTSGGNEANFSGLAMALAWKFPNAIEDGVATIGAQPFVYASSESHHSLDKSAGLLGIGRKALRRVAVNERLQLDRSALDAAIEADLRLTRDREEPLRGGPVGPAGGVHGVRDEAGAGAVSVGRGQRE